ncbi:PDZ domain-containing protein [Paenibacillus sedimenti]|uniref:PDZ domain-containing protein n=1 Tax=Paenibacillus sedimenti TaxID=2770274 RepID=A0A926KP55_9BACL|nr:PDZ domain-containing protein [Paenibacillus sedimenti]MBD0381439.1 PDZ domain-containing protein [Paenibacillus sedimenti]
MKPFQRLYYLGMVLALFLFVAGELIWLPDPLRFGNGVYWIDALDLLVYVLALIPLIWAITAGFILVRLRRIRVKRRFGWAQLRSGAVIIAGVTAIIVIITIPKKLEFSVSALVLTWLLVFVDLFFIERNLRKIPVQSISAFVVTICLLIVLFFPTRYLVTYPGMTLNMSRYAQANGGSPHGEISGVLVFDRPAFPIDWVYAKLFPHYTFEVNNLGISIGEYNQQVRVMKSDANAAGSAIALQKLGRGKGIIPKGVLVTGLAPNSPVEGILRQGDVIEEVSGQAIKTVQELTDRLAATSPGDQVEVKVLRNSNRETLSAKTRANPDNPKRAAFGIDVSNELQYDIPETINYHNYLLHEGGPSHGAMLALTLIDQFTPWGILHGNKVAGTGTIEPDGSIGPVGGLEQKAYTVSRTDADVFFVPVKNEKDARKGAPGLQIVPVRTLDDILSWLRENPKQPGITH